MDKYEDFRHDMIGNAVKKFRDDAPKFPSLEKRFHNLNRRLGAAREMLMSED